MYLYSTLTLLIVYVLCLHLINEHFICTDIQRTYILFLYYCFIHNLTYNALIHGHLGSWKVIIS